MIYSPDGKWVIGGLVGHRVVMLRWPIPALPIPPKPRPDHIPHELS